MKRCNSIRSIAAAAAVTAVAVLPLSCSREPGSSDNAPDRGESLIIEPGMSVGMVRAGMTVDELTQKLGQPGHRTANALEYPNLGLAVMPDATGHVLVVMCGDVTGVNGPFVKKFAGRTKEGIGMLSTREELVKAYGPPTSAERLPGGMESIKYDSLGITFTLEGGKIHHMIVRLTGSPPPPAAIEIKP